jgi:hypothetical protein
MDRDWQVRAAALQAACALLGGKSEKVTGKEMTILLAEVHRLADGFVEYVNFNPRTGQSFDIF